MRIADAGTKFVTVDCRFSPFRGYVGAGQTGVTALVSNLEVEYRREWQAGLFAMALVAAYVMVEMLVDVASTATEFERIGRAPEWGRSLNSELTSRLVLLAMFPGLILLSIHLPISRDNWKRRVALYAIMAIGYSAMHIAAMVLLRKITWPVMFGVTYEFVPATVSFMTEALYEVRKDIVTFCVFLGAIYLSRNYSQIQQELEVARQDAKRSSRLSLKCGGRSIYLDVSEVQWAKAAGNYVEIMAHGREHLARTTLTALLEQLEAGGADAIRVHRSWLVNPQLVTEVRPGKGGDAIAITRTGSEVPVSRSYKETLNSALSASGTAA